MFHCSHCNTTVSGPIEEHSCTIESMQDSKESRLNRLLASGGCSQEYYDEEMAILKDEMSDPLCMECHDPDCKGCNE